MNVRSSLMNEKSPPTIPKKPLSRTAHALRTFLDGSYLARDKLTSWIPFAIFLTVLGLIYIRINYQSINREQEIIRLRKELQEIHYDYVQMKTRINLITQPSILEKELEPYGIKRLRQPPYKIFLQQSSFTR